MTKNLPLHINMPCILNRAPRLSCCLQITPDPHKSSYQKKGLWQQDIDGLWQFLSVITSMNIAVQTGSDWYMAYVITYFSRNACLCT